MTENIPDKLVTAPLLLALPDADDRTLFALLLRKAGIADGAKFYATSDELMASLTALVDQSLAAVLPIACFIEANLPGLGAEHIVRWIRAQPALNRLSVIVMSDAENPASIRQVGQAGAQCYLAKYPQPRVLKQVIEEARRLADTSVVGEWFGCAANLLLRWFTPRRAARAAV